MLNFISRAYAQGGLRGVTLTPISETRNSLPDLVSTVIEYLLIAAGALVVIYLVYGGILYITAGGDAEKATKGRTAVVNAVIGVIIILLAYLIVGWVKTALNAN